MQHFFGILLLLPVALCYNCTNQPDGNYEISCRAYSSCTSGVFQRVSCADGKVYNSDNKKCDNATNVKPPCGVQKDCSAKKDGQYADRNNNCNSYYTCASGAFFGHTFCPAGTVFDEDMETCNWPQDVLPPCGTGKKP